MKTRSAIALIVATVFLHAGFAQDILDLVQRLSAIEKSEAPLNHSEYLTVTDEAIRAWSAISANERHRFAAKMFLVHFRRAEIMASLGDFKAAANELKEEARIQKEFDGRLEFATKSPDNFFRGLVELQAQLTAETGSDPLAGQVAYSFERDGEGFVAARLELGDDIAGITVPEIGADEALALVHSLNKQGGKFVATASRWLVVPKGRLPKVLNLATREVVFDSTGKMIVHRMQTQGESSPSASSVTNARQWVPGLVQPPAPKQVDDAKPAPAKSEEPPSLTPWSIIVVLIVAAIGLLWLLLKLRS